MEKLIQVEACSSVLWRQQLKLAVLCRLLQLFAGNLAASLCFHHFLMLSCWKLSFMIREVTFLHCPVPFSSSQGGIPKQTKAVTFLCVCVCVCWPQHGAVLLLRKVGHTFCRLAKWIFDIKVAFVQIQGPLGGKTGGSWSWCASALPVHVLRCKQGGGGRVWRVLCVGAKVPHSKHPTFSLGSHLGHWGRQKPWERCRPCSSVIFDCCQQFQDSLRQHRQGLWIQ